MPLPPEKPVELETEYRVGAESATAACAVKDKKYMAKPHDRLVPVS